MPRVDDIPKPIRAANAYSAIERIIEMFAGPNYWLAEMILERWCDRAKLSEPKWYGFNLRLEVIQLRKRMEQAVENDEETLDVTQFVLALMDMGRCGGLDG